MADHEHRKPLPGCSRRNPHRAVVSHGSVIKPVAHDVLARAGAIGPRARENDIARRDVARGPVGTHRGEFVGTGRGEEGVEIDARCDAARS